MSKILSQLLVLFSLVLDDIMQAKPAIPPGFREAACCLSCSPQEDTGMVGAISNRIYDGQGLQLTCLT